MTPLILPMLIIPVIALASILFSKGKTAKRIVKISTALNLLITFVILLSSIMSGSVNISEQYSYISSMGISLGLSINIVSLALLIMSSVVLFATALAGNPENEHPKLSSALVALFQFASVGLFTSASMFLFFIFWDIGIIALFFMLYLLGSPNRTGSAMKFLVYEVFASSLLLFGILLLYIYMPGHNIQIAQIAASAAQLPTNVQLMVFFLLFGAFMTNMPLFPFHSWLPDAHAEASTQGSMVLSGVLTKFGGFGILLLFGMLPIARTYSSYVAALAILSAIYVAFVLMKQTDLKRIIAYSTIVEMGVILVGIAQ